MAQLSNSLYITVEVAFGTASAQWVIVCKLGLNSTVQQAIEQAEIEKHWPSWQTEYSKIGIFGRLVTFERLLQDGERIEIYRPLLVDPMTARRLRAKRSLSQNSLG